MNGKAHPWHVGILWNCGYRIASPMMKELRTRPESLVVGDNLPHSGKDLAYSLDFHARATGIAHCAV